MTPFARFGTSRMLHMRQDSFLFVDISAAYQLATAANKAADILTVKPSDKKSRRVLMDPTSVPSISTELNGRQVQH